MSTMMCGRNCLQRIPCTLIWLVGLAANATTPFVVKNDHHQQRASNYYVVDTANVHDDDDQQQQDINIHPLLDDLVRLDPFSVHLFGHTVNSSSVGGTLIKTKIQQDVMGEDVHGTFHETIVDWDSPSTWPIAPHNSTYFQTSIKAYYHGSGTDDVKSGDSRDERIHQEEEDVDSKKKQSSIVVVIFTQRYPLGVPDDDDCFSSSATNPLEKGVDENDNDDVINMEPTTTTTTANSGAHKEDHQHSTLRSSFPSLNFGNSMHYFSYHGYFLERHNTGKFPTTTNNTLNDGIEAGPLLLFEGDKHHRSSNNNARCGILSHYNEFMTQTTRHEQGTSTVSLGPMDSICPLPAGFEAKMILVMNTQPSIHNAVQKWGSMLLDEYMGKRDHRFNRRMHELDYTTRYLGYSTDNGAYYYYQREEDYPVTANMEETMIAVAHYADQMNIPYRYWLLDSWWYYKLQKTHGSQSPVTSWTPRPDVFPHGLQHLFEMTGYYVQAHNRMWAKNNTYRSKYNFIDSVGDNTFVSLPTEYKFWKDLFHNATSWGLVVYEQDWLNVQYELQSQAYTNATLMRLWLLEMGRAAQDCRLAIQYCMPLARHILQSVEIPTVTQVRASNDYHPGWQGQWNIGITSLLYYALDLRPSKDSTWTISEQPNTHYENTSEPFSEFQTMILAMSTGPVAFSDKIGYSNVSLIMSTCRQDGVLLQPAQPLIPIHKWFYGRAQEDLASSGHVQESSMKVNGLPRYVIVMAVELQQLFLLYPRHLSYDFAERSVETWVVYDNSLSYILQDYNKHNPLPLQPSQSLGDYELFYIAPVVMGWCLLGERNKFVPLSSNRFMSVEVTSLSMKLTVEGNPGESIDIAYVFHDKDRGNWTMQSKSVRIPSSGSLQVNLEKPLSAEKALAL